MNGEYDKHNHDLLIELRTDIKWIKKKFEEYSKKFDDIDTKFSKLDTKISKLEAFKWKVIGFAIGASALVSFIVSLISFFHHL